jgi:hypothetical protein
LDTADTYLKSITQGQYFILQLTLLLYTEGFVLWHAAQCSDYHCFMSQVSHVLVQYIAVSIKFLLAIFKEYTGNVIIWLALCA